MSEEFGNAFVECVNGRCDLYLQFSCGEFAPVPHDLGGDLCIRGCRGVDQEVIDVICYRSELGCLGISIFGVGVAGIQLFGFLPGVDEADS